MAEKDLGKLEDDMGSISSGALKAGVIGGAKAYKDTTPPPKKDPRDANIYTADKGQPPSPNEGPTKTVKKAKGGYVRAADGCAQRGKTRGKLV